MGWKRSKLGQQCSKLSNLKPYVPMTECNDDMSLVIGVAKRQSKVRFTKEH